MIILTVTVVLFMTVLKYWQNNACFNIFPRYILQSGSNKLVFDLPLVSVFPCTRVCQLKFSVKATAITIQNAFSAIVSSMLASNEKNSLLRRKFI